MLKRLFCCLSLLLSLCLLFPVFSVSISAISVDGYEVSTYVDTEDFADFVEFENTIVLDSFSDYLLIIFDIDFPEVIPKDTVFDLEVSFSLDDFGSIEPFVLGSAYDVSHNQLDCDLSAVIEDGKLIETDICVDGDIKFIRYVFVIYDPSFNVVSKDSSFSSAVDLYGTSWKLNDSLSMPANRIYVYSDESSDTICHYDMFIPKKSFNFSGYPLLLSYYHSGFYSFQIMNENYASSFSHKGGAYGFDIRDLSASEITFHSGFNVSDGFIEWLQSNANLLTPNNGYSKYSFDFAVTSVNVIEKDDDGIFVGIFGWVKKIFNAIRNLPNQIGDLIKGLFIPSEEAIIELKDKFEALFSDRFGAAYQSIEVVEQFGQAMGISTYSDTVDTITFPSVIVPLAGTEFTFGGWEVDLVPKGFEGLITPLKLIVDLVCTIACVNMFRRRMEGVLR